jgi:hypothetical protein
VARADHQAGELSSVTDFEADREELLDEIRSIHAGLRENPDDDWLRVDLRYALEELNELNKRETRDRTLLDDEDSPEPEPSADL